MDNVLSTPFTDRCPRGQRRIRNEIVPELVAWLSVIGKRFERQFKTLVSRDANLLIPGAVGCAANAKQAIRTIQLLISLTMDRFSDPEFNIALREFEQNAGIKGASVPSHEITNEMMESASEGE